MTRAQARERQPRAAGGVLVAHAGAALYGSDRMALESVEALHAAGLRPTLCLPADGPLAEEARRRGLAVVVLPFPVVRKSALSPRGALRFAAQTARAVPALVALLRRERCSAVYVNTMTVPVWVACARFLRLPVLVHVHEAETTAPRPLQALLAAPLLAAHTAVYNSEYSLRAVTAVAPSTAGRSQVVYNGVAGPPSGPSPAPPSSGPLRVLYLGRVSERKGVLVALDAVDELLARGREVHLQVVGDTFVEHEAFAALVRERTSSSRLRGRVTLHGFSDAVWSHLEACHVLVVPSVLPEPFGNTAAEGLLAGRPVLASDIGGLPEVLRGTSSSRLVPAGDAGALADELDRLASDLPARGVQAQADAVLAAVRFAPAAYGRHIVDAVSGVLS